MHHFRSIRQLALGAAVAGAAIGAVPAMANAASTCSYSPDGGGVVSVTDGSNDGIGTVEKLRIAIVGQFITVGDGNRQTNACRGPAGFALTTNTSQINVTAKFREPRRRHHRRPVPGRLGPGAASLRPTATPSWRSPRSSPDPSTSGPSWSSSARPDPTSSGSAASSARSTSAPTTTPTSPPWAASTRSASTAASATTSSPGPATPTARRAGPPFPSSSSGSFGRDILMGGDATDVLSGEADNDGLYSSDGVVDHLFGGQGVDDATADFKDDLRDVEIRSLSSVGRLRLAPRFLRARAGKTARLTMSWKHPKAWRELRTVKLGLYRGNEAVGMINARPGSGRLAGHRRGSTSCPGRGSATTASGSPRSWPCACRSRSPARPARRGAGNRPPRPPAARARRRRDPRRQVARDAAGRPGRAAL